MGLTAIAASSSAGASAPSLNTSIGLGISGALVALIVVYLAAYLNVVNGLENERPELRDLLAGSVTPLVVVFTGIIVYESLLIV